MMVYIFVCVLCLYVCVCVCVCHLNKYILYVYIIYMFSKEALIYMANGTYKSVSEVKTGEYIMNKLYAPTKVIRVHKLINKNVIEMQLHNGTKPFFCSPEIIVYCHHTTPDGKHHTEYTCLNEVYANKSKLKSSIKPFSPNTDVDILTYNNTNPELTKDLYCIHTIDPTGSFIVNGIIALVNTD